MRMRSLTLFVLVFLPALASAQEVGQEAVQSSNPWMPIITGIIAMVTSAALYFLRKKWKVDTEKQEIDKSKSLMEQRNFLIDNRLLPFALGTAEHWINTQLPLILSDLGDGGEFAWKDHWSDLHKYVKARVIQKFAKENIDIIDFMGEVELDQLLDRVGMSLIARLPPSLKAFLPGVSSDDGPVPASIDKLTDAASKFVLDKGKELLGVH